MRVFAGLPYLALLLLGTVLSDSPQNNYPDPVQVAVVEDHPWVIKNETCLKDAEGSEDTFSKNDCYYGFLIDLMNKIDQELQFNYTYESYSAFGKLDDTVDPPKWTGAIGAVVDKKAHMVLAVLNVTEDLKKVVDFSSPIVDNSKTNQTLALAFTKGLKSQLKKSVSHMIKKLVNQRHIEQLKEVWFHESKSRWEVEKQLTQLKS